jgi:uncharacterized OB-fold protein
MTDATTPPVRPIYEKPVPTPDPGTLPYWRALQRHELIFQQCRACQHRFAPYQPVCPSCWSQDVADQPSSGKGTIYTFSIVYRAPVPAHRPDLPYAVALVQLDEGPYVTTNIVGSPVDEIRIGQPVEVVFEDVTEEITLAKFRLRAG